MGLDNDFRLIVPLSIKSMLIYCHLDGNIFIDESAFENICRKSTILYLKNRMNHPF